MINFDALFPEKGRPAPDDVADAFVSEPLYDVLPWEDGVDTGSCYPL